MSEQRNHPPASRLKHWLLPARPPALICALGPTACEPHRPTPSVVRARMALVRSRKNSWAADEAAPLDPSERAVVAALAAKVGDEARGAISRRRACHSAAPPLPSVGVSIETMGECQQNDSLAAG